MASTEASTVVSEMSPTMSSTYSLIFHRFITRKISKLIFWGHGYNKKFEKSFLIRFYKSIIYFFIYRLCDGIIFYSKDGFNLLENSNLKNKSIVAPNAINLDKIKKHRKYLDSYESEINLISLGRLTEQHNYINLLRIHKIVNKTHPHIKLTLIGGGAQEERLRDYIQDNNLNADLVGALYDEEKISNFLNMADLALFGAPSGLAINHVMAYGIPVILFENSIEMNHGPENIYVKQGVTGYRINEYNNEIFAKKIIHLMDQDVRPKEKMYSNIINYIESEASIYKMAEKFYEITERLN